MDGCHDDTEASETIREHGMVYSKHDTFDSPGRKQPLRDPFRFRIMVLQDSGVPPPLSVVNCIPATAEGTPTLVRYKMLSSGSSPGQVGQSLRLAALFQVGLHRLSSARSDVLLLPRLEAEEQLSGSKHGRRSQFRPGQVWKMKMNTDHPAWNILTLPGTHMEVENGRERKTMQSTNQTGGAIHFYVSCRGSYTYSVVIVWCHVPGPPPLRVSNQ